MDGFNGANRVMIKIDISQKPSQLEIAKWAVDSMEFLPEEDQMELWGKSYTEIPISIRDGFIIFQDNNPEVVKDLLSRIEDQYIVIADAESRKAYHKVLPLCFKLASKIRNVFFMELIEIDDLKII